VSGAQETLAWSDRAPDVQTIARYTIWLILAYLGAHLLLRLGISGNLKTDEAQFVGHTGFALGYGNSHPPVYNWLVAGALYLTGSWAAAVNIVKTAFLAGTYLLVYDIGRRVTGHQLTGLIAAASLLFLPQIVWKSQITLAHSVMVMFGVIATLHAVILIRERGLLGDFLWLGVAASIGAFAKYNYFFALIAILLAAWSVRDVREKLFVPRLVWPAALFVLLYLPHGVWAVANLAASTERIAKLDREHPVFSVLDVPRLGIDGLLTMAVAALAWAGPLIAVWFVVWRLTPVARPGRQSESAQHAAQFFARVTSIGAGLFAAVILLGDFDAVHERYMTPLLMSLPLWLATAWPLELHGRAAVHFLRTSAVVALLILVAWPGWILLGKEQLAYPYRQFAAEITRQTNRPFAILASRDKIAANLVIRIDGASMLSPGSDSPDVLIVWEGHADAAPEHLRADLGSSYAARGAPRRLTAPYDNFSGQTARLSYQLFQRPP